MTNNAIIGLGFGDEGKGITTDFLCSQFSNPLVVRFSGGHQAGHTVYYDGKKHIFSNFGSGTLRGVPTFWSKFCTVDPVGLMNELDVLKEIGITPQLFIDGDAPITTPYDKFYNRKTELVNQHGSCGVGFGATVEREIKHYSLTFSDLFYPDITKFKLDMIKGYYEQRVNESRFFEFPLFLESWNYFESSCEEIINLPFIEKRTLQSIMCSDYVFEGSQGILLDTNFGFFPHVSWSNCGSKNIIDMVGNDIHYYLITRAYQTRHGNGPMTNEDEIHNIEVNPEETNVDRKWQGKFRRALLDIDLLQYAIGKDKAILESKNKTLVVTCLDHIQNDFRFTYRGNIVECKNELEFLSKIANLLKIDNFLISHSPDSKNFKRKHYNVGL